jgi:hypothetical protein
MNCSSLRCAYLLRASNTFVLQDSDHDTPVVSLTFRRCIGRNLPAGTHGARSKNVRRRNVTLLFEEIGYLVSSDLTVDQNSAGMWMALSHRAGIAAPSASEGPEQLLLGTHL